MLLQPRLQTLTYILHFTDFNGIIYNSSENVVPDPANTYAYALSFNFLKRSTSKYTTAP